MEVRTNRPGASSPMPPAACHNRRAVVHGARSLAVWPRAVVCTLGLLHYEARLWVLRSHPMPEARQALARRNRDSGVDARRVPAHTLERLDPVESGVHNGALGLRQQCELSFREGERLAPAPACIQESRLFSQQTLLIHGHAALPHVLVQAPGSGHIAAGLPRITDLNQRLDG